MQSKRTLATPSGYTASVLQDKSNEILQLQITAVPEPNVSALLGGLDLLLLVRRR